MSSALPRPEFLVTKEYRRFAELCDAVRRHRYIGLCYGPPGVGKTLSARHYACWDSVGPWLGRHRVGGDDTPPELGQTKTAFYTPTVTTTPRQLALDIPLLEQAIDYAVEDLLHSPTLCSVELGAGRITDPVEALERTQVSVGERVPHAELLIVDEADRLKTPGLEQLRDHFDRTGVGLILIGMPGLERRLARYPQLYSRIGFAHEYHALSADELTFVPSLALPGSRRLPRGFHRRGGHGRCYPHHRGQLPAHPPPVLPGRAHPGDQRASYHHQGGHRGRSGSSGDRTSVIPPPGNTATTPPLTTKGYIGNNNAPELLRRTRRHRPSAGAGGLRFSFRRPTPGRSMTTPLPWRPPRCPRRPGGPTPPRSASTWPGWPAPRSTGSWEP